MIDQETSPFLQVEDLSVTFATPHGSVRAVDGVSFELRRGQSLGIVGESGSGKTILTRSIMGLVHGPNVEVRGRVLVDGVDMAALSVREARKIRGRDVAMVFQNPMTSLNPVLKIGMQLTEGMRHHLGLSKAESRELAVELLRGVGITAPERRLSQYPFELSGGMRQRVTIAIAMACNPKLLIADEPTTALDVTIQAQILALLDAKKRERDMGMIVVTHDLSIVAGHTDEIIVMYAGKIVEHAPAVDLFTNTRMPYTQALLNSIPGLDEPTHTPLPTIAGRPPSPTSIQKGCRFAARCTHARDVCSQDEPELVGDGTSSHTYACWYPIGNPLSAGSTAAVQHRLGVDA